MKLANKEFKGLHYSRFVASWIRMGGIIDYHGSPMFRKWLEQLVIGGEHIPKEIQNEIYWFAHTGACELEYDAKNFIKNYSED